jgi:hypothetical protein
MFKPIGDVRNKTADDVKDFAAQNPDMLHDPNTSGGKSKPIKAKNPRNIVMPGSKNSNQNNDEIDFGIFDKAISEQDSVLNDGEFVTLSDESEESIQQPSAQVENLNSSGRTDLSFVQNLKKKYNLTEEQEEAPLKKVASIEAEKVISTFDKKLAQIKSLENEILGFKTSMERDFNGEWIVYRYPSTVIAFDPKDPNFTSVDSGIYMDPSEGLWYLNTEGGNKYLIYAGSLSDSVSLKKPDNYDIVKQYTLGSGEYILEGSDLHHILKPEYMENFGIKVADAVRNTYSLEVYSKQELQNLFIANGINILITEI